MPDVFTVYPGCHVLYQFFNHERSPIRGPVSLPDITYHYLPQTVRPGVAEVAHGEQEPTHVVGIGGWGEEGE